MPQTTIFLDTHVVSLCHFFSGSLLKDLLISEAFPDHPVLNGLYPCPLRTRCPSSLLYITTSRIWGELLGEGLCHSDTGKHTVGPACISVLALSVTFHLGTVTVSL